MMMRLSEKLTRRSSTGGRLFLLVLVAGLAVAMSLSMAFAADAEAKRKKPRKPPTTNAPAPTPPNCNRPPAGGYYGETVARAWGSNGLGQLGSETQGSPIPGTPANSSNTPVKVSNLSGVQGLDAGGHYSLALKTDCTVWAWGDNAFGQLGDGTTNFSITPVQVGGLSGVRAIAAGDRHSLALKEDGTVFAWGTNWAGQLGDGTTTGRTTPVQVGGLSGVRAIAAGDRHSLALKEDGTVFAWGHNGSGQLGNGTYTSSTTPVQVKDFPTLQPASSSSSSSQASFPGAEPRSPYVNLSGVKAIAAGGHYSLALMEDGSVRAWGDNAFGQLGDGTTTGRNVPVKVQNLSEVQGIDAGLAHSLAFKTDGTVWVWGDNYHGQLGDGTSGNQRNTTPVQVSGLSGAKAVAGGWYHSLALKADGTVFAWGHNYYGQLGDGTYTNRTTPVKVRNLSGVKAITAGGVHSLAKVLERPVAQQ